jgi:uncharacterized membrane protein
MQEADSQYNVLVRLIAFSDGVFAFAITLLIITIPYPNSLPASLSAGQFFGQLYALKSYFISYLFSFYIIGMYWLAHHLYFRYIIKFDEDLFLINLTLLLFIAFLPFPTYLLGHYGDRPIVVAFYGGMLSLISLLFLLLWWYATTQHRLISSTLDQNVIRYVQVRRLAQSSMFIISIGLALIAPFLAEAAWTGSLIVLMLTSKVPKKHHSHRLGSVL